MSVVFVLRAEHQLRKSRGIPVRPLEKRIVIPDDVDVSKLSKSQKKKLKKKLSKEGSVAYVDPTAEAMEDALEVGVVGKKKKESKISDMQRVIFFAFGG